MPVGEQRTAMRETMRNAARWDVLTGSAPQHEKPCHLQIYVSSLELALQRGQYDQAVRLIERNVLATFYGVESGRLKIILEQLLSENVDRHGIVKGMLLMFPGREGAEQTQKGMPALGPTPEVNVMLHSLAALASKRLRGLAHRTRKELRRLDERVHLVDQLFGSADGWGLIIPVQSGITAMLSGDFARALKYYAQAQMQPLVHPLAFFTRDAYAKAALLHATFGDEREARTALEQAAKIPRTISWVEQYVDSTVHLTEAMLSHDGAESAVERMNEIPLHLIGELWPYYIIALERLYERAGRQREIGDRLSMLENAPLPRIDGESVAGSVFPVARATINLRRGDIEVARQLLSEADPDYVGTQLVLVHLELSQSRTRQALSLATKFGAEPAYAGLRQISVWRHSTLALVQLRADQHGEAEVTLRNMLLLPGGVRDGDASSFSPAVLEFAERRVEGWPSLAPVQNRFSPHERHHSTRLSARELQVVRLLAGDATQQDIARQLFVSPNTLKTHIRAIYRKLGVNSRRSAVLRAGQEGWL